MSGLVGFFDNKCSVNKGKKRLKELINLLTHKPFYENDTLFERNGVYSSRSHKSHIQYDPQPYRKQDLFIWFNGEIYNGGAFSPQNNISDLELITSLYLENRSFSFLNKIDGIFSAVIYDSLNNKIFFLTDRFGFKLLYFCKTKERLAWFSEAKGALALDYFSPQINEDSLHNFFSKGYLTENKSWLKNVELFPPASVSCWDISKRKFADISYYWSWDDLPRPTDNVKEDEIIEKMGSLFREAVNKRSHPTNEVCVPLSGGLDSRAIVAAFPETSDTLHTYTFGKQDCWDIKIARQVSLEKNATHHLVFLNSDNWFDHRIDGVWWTDGQMNLQHMHVLKLLEEYSKAFKISLNGFLGDAIQGGYYLEGGPSAFIEKITNRGRRFINEGSRLGEAYGVFYRRPFIDNELLEFTLKQPLNLREKSYLYNKMLINEFPEYFQNIVWQRTGRKISTSKTRILVNRKLHALRNRGIALFKNLHFPIVDNKDYHNYADWLREKPDFIEKVLHNPSAIYCDFINRDEVFKKWQNHLNGRDFSEEICAYLTFEIFLQQVFMSKHRPNI